MLGKLSLGIIKDEGDRPSLCQKAALNVIHTCNAFLHQAKKGTTTHSDGKKQVTLDKVSLSFMLLRKPVCQSQCRREKIKRVIRRSNELAIAEKNAELNQLDADDEEQREWLEGEIDNLETELAVGQLKPLDLDYHCCGKVFVFSL